MEKVSLCDSDVYTEQYHNERQNLNAESEDNNEKQQ